MVNPPEDPSKQKVLIIEDDQTMREMVAYNLRKAGFEVSEEADGRRGLGFARSGDHDLIITDLMLPSLDGVQIVREVRRTRPDVAILMLTARAENEMRLAGFDVGVDDYLTKPFLMDELVARVKALLRRARPRRTTGTDDSAPLVFGDLRLSTKDQRCWVADDEVELRPKEFGLLAMLASEPGRLFGRDEMAERVWGYTELGNTRTIDTHVKTIRRKIEAASAYSYIDTVRGAGYRFRVRPRDEHE